MSEKTQRKVDPITFEILRHRLQLAVEEAAQTLKEVSGSPVASEIGDLNISIMDKTGVCVAIGQYAVPKGTCLSFVVKDVLANYTENPGIKPGDAFFCNDPYVGVMHQNDVGVVMPYFRDGKLLAWVGADVYQTDVGGPCPGQVQLGAKNIYGEAPLMPPMKILSEGTILKDVERNYCRHSREPDLIALDLRAKIAACNTLCRSLDSVYAKLGGEGLEDFFDDMLNDAERLLTEKLKRIPDGRWSARGFLEFEDKAHPVVSTIIKTGGHMVFDFTGTAEQAPATINMTKNAVVALLGSQVASVLCWDIPWTIGGIERTYDVTAPEGTLVNPTFPAGVSKSTTSLGMLLNTIFQIAMSKMLMSSPEYADKAMAAWPGSKAQEELHGFDQYGEEFVADILDGMAGGGGARLYKDGVDTGGLMGAPKISISNVEEYEQQYPILYLYRRELPDSGGYGTFRGGNGMDRMYIVHDAERIDDVIMHSIGSKIPATCGIAGGHPSATNLFMCKRSSSIEKMMSEGTIPSDFSQADGTTEIYGTVTESHLDRNDIYRVISNGGGGYGDPLKRDIALIEEDCRCKRATKDIVREFYGCVIGDDGKADIDATELLRAKLRGQRLKKAKMPEHISGMAMKTKKFALHDNLICGIAEDGKAHIFCSCGADLGFADENYNENMAVYDAQFSETGAYVDKFNTGRGEYFLREYFCPRCGTELQNELLAHGMEPLPADTIKL